jgi:hypothetical protein
MKLSILTVTRFERHTPRFLRHFRAVADILGAEFVVGCDRCEPAECGADIYVPVETRGMIEHALIEAHDACSGEYVLRLDDDETLSAAAIFAVADWSRLDSDEKVYAFPRANLWGDEKHAIVSGSLFPDLQTRLMPRGRENRTRLHQAIDTSSTIPGMILHHKFLVKTREEREEIAIRYEEIDPGGGSGHYLQFSVPESCFDIEVQPVLSGWVSRK